MKIRYELNALQYPIVIEMYDKIKFGRYKRAFNKEFNLQEKNKIRYWYSIFYKWYLIKGTPQKHNFSFETLEFIKRMINFFATLT